MPTANPNLIALDIGTRRIGVAIASVAARLPRPLVTLQNDAEFWLRLEKIISDNEVVAIVVGLPRNLSGQNTQQTRYTEELINSIKLNTNLPIYVQDETLSSHRASEELRLTKRSYSKPDVDALAASYILQEFLLENQESAIA